MYLMKYNDKYGCCASLPMEKLHAISAGLVQHTKQVDNNTCLTPVCHLLPPYFVLARRCGRERS